MFGGDGGGVRIVDTMDSAATRAERSRAGALLHLQGCYHKGNGGGSEGEYDGRDQCHAGHGASLPHIVAVMEPEWLPKRI